MKKDEPIPKKSGKNIAWIVIILLLLAGNVILLLSLLSTRSDLERYSDVRDELSNYDIELTDCRVRLEDALEREKETENRLQSKDRHLRQIQQEIEGMTTLSSKSIADLKSKGLKNPEEDIKSDLMKHPEMIPVKPSPGGEMGFYNRRQIYVLNRYLVYASFSDGKKNGMMILEYDVANNGKIVWKPLKAYENL